MASTAAFPVDESGLIIGAEASNIGGDINIRNSFQDNQDTGFDVTEAGLYDGYTIWLNADKDGYTVVMSDVDTNSDNETWLTFSGTFAGSEFVDYFSGGHFYYAAQKYNTGEPLVSNISDAAISVISEQADTPEFTAGGAYVSGGSLVIGFTGSAGYEYIIESTDDLTSSDPWTVITNITLSESPAEVALPVTNSEAFYRVRSE